MKQSFLSRRAGLLSLAAGIAGVLLRLGIYARAVDEKGLLIPDHPLQIALWVLAAAVGALAVLAPEKGPREDRDFRLEALGELLAGAGLALSVPTGLPHAATALDGVRLVLCLAAAGGLALSGIRRIKGGSGHILCYAPACLFFALYLVSRYRGWSSHPQLQDWFFPVLGVIFSMLFAYLRCEPEKYRLRRTVALAGTFACFAAMAAAQDPTLFLGAGIWMATNLHAPGEVL